MYKKLFDVENFSKLFRSPLINSLNNTAGMTSNIIAILCTQHNILEFFCVLWASTQLSLSKVSYKRQWQWQQYHLCKMFMRTFSPFILGFYLKNNLFTELNIYLRRICFWCFFLPCAFQWLIFLIFLAHCKLLLVKFSHWNNHDDYRWVNK